MDVDTYGCNARPHPPFDACHGTSEIDVATLSEGGDVFDFNPKVGPIVNVIMDRVQSSRCYPCWRRLCGGGAFDKARSCLSNSGCSAVAL